MNISPATSGTARIVLIAHPLPEVGGRLQSQFEQQGWFGLLCSSGKDLLALLEQFEPALVVSELRLSDGPCLPLLKLMRQQRSWIDVVVVTGHGSAASAVECHRDGITTYLQRGASAATILSRLSNPVELAECQAGKPSHFDRLCWEYINRVVSYAGSISHAASLMDVDRRTLRRMLSNYAPGG